MRIVSLIMLLILYRITLTNCQLIIPVPSPTSPPIESPAVSIENPFSARPPIPPISLPISSGPSIAQTPTNPIIAVSTTTKFVAPSATTLSPTATIVAYVTDNRGYGIQILVNGNSPLREYSELYETSKEQITTKPSFIQDINTNKYYESDKTVFVAVPRPGMKFTIKLWADSATRKTYRVHAYIDGTWDNASYTLTDAHSTVIDYFIDEHDKKKYNFIFTSSMWTDDESKVNVKENNIHGFGSISVEFFEAEWTLKENENPSYTIVKDSNGSNGLSYHTQFEEAPLTEEERPLIKRVVNRNGVGAYYGWKSADKPSAVLTVHYRPKAWLKLRGLTSDPLYSRLSPDFTSESENSEYEYEKYSRIIYESEDEIEIGRRNLRRRSRTQKYIDFDEDSYHKRRSRVEERRITPDKTPGGIRSSTNNNYRTPVNNTKLTAIEKCNGKRVDNSRKDKNISNTSSVKFSSYFEEIIEETKFIDITVGSNKPTEEIRQNKKLREIIEILDSDDEV